VGTSSQQDMKADINVKFETSSLSLMDRMALKRYQEINATPQPNQQSSSARSLSPRLESVDFADSSAGRLLRYGDVPVQERGDNCVDCLEIEAIGTDEEVMDLESNDQPIVNTQPDYCGKQEPRTLSSMGKLSIVSLDFIEQREQQEKLYVPNNGRDRSLSASHSSLEMRRAMMKRAKSEQCHRTPVDRVWTPRPKYQSMDDFFLVGVRKPEIESETTKESPEWGKGRLPSVPYTEMFPDGQGLMVEEMNKDRYVVWHPARSMWMTETNTDKNWDLSNYNDQHRFSTDSFNLGEVVNQYNWEDDESNY